MEMSKTKSFDFSMDTAWEALHKASSLDVEPGAKVEVISDVEWKARTHDQHGKEISCTHYTASFDDAEKVVTIEGVSSVKKVHDYIYLRLSGESAGQVSLKIDIEINLGLNLIARAIAPMVKKHSEELITKQIFGNFEALCKGEATNALTQEELDVYAKDAVEKHFSKS